MNLQTTVEPALGIDIGGTITENIGAAHHRPVLSALPYPNAFLVLRQLEARFREKRFLVSRISEKSEPISRQWLNAYSFFPTTGITEDHLVYCRKIEDKARICAELGITHFIDNRMAVLKHLAGIVRCLILFCPNEEAVREEIERNEFDESVIIVSSWDEIAELFGV